ncbi:hypothetical protein HY642_03740 [Candidatus Woesearchaeota archaeon]|nr:hypothetical protein [Candidatus Woesearchaeota archaeon]
MDFTIKLCKDKAGLSARPAKQTLLNLPGITSSFTALMRGPLVSVITVDGIEIVAHRYGELIFKGLFDEAKARILAEQVYAAGVP